MLWIARHGQSAGNLARDLAEATGSPTITLTTREIDVPLSPLGQQQAGALGRWLARQPAAVRPTVVLASPYLRARDTAALLLQAAAASDADLGRLPVRLDERLRERELGILDGLTRQGIESRHPQQAELMTLLRKFYHRPPGGESWCDVILRLRSVMHSLQIEYAGERVLLVCHSAVMLCFRYLLEHLTEEQILTIDRENTIANCALTIYKEGADPTGPWQLLQFNFVAPLEQEGAPISQRKSEPT